MPESAGQPFGKYVLLDRIAAGGMAEIFQAKYVAAAGVTKHVVIKRILPSYAGNSAFVSMFINEAKIAVTLSHGNIAQVFDFGEIDGEYFLAMEHVNGPALSRLARRSLDLGLHVPIPIGVHVTAEILAGLHYAHTRTDERGKPLGIVHRDVSPQNVIVSYEGQVKLVDFGIARMRSAGDVDQGGRKGKYLYFSPEQAKGRTLDGRSDVFATGIVLYELITGARPFEGPVNEVLERIAKAEFPPPSAVNPDVSPELESILMKAMARKPDDRWATALEMHDALEQHLHALDPTFSAGSVGHFTRHLCREDLERDGITVEVPKDFVDQLERWRAPPRFNSKPRGAGAPEAPLGRVTSRANTVGALQKPRPLAALLKLERVALFLAGLAALTALAGLVYDLSHRPRTFLLEINSEPGGAHILINGRDTGFTTPARIEGLNAAAPHEIDLAQPGFVTFHTSVPAPAGDHAAVEATLEKIEPPKPPVEPPKIEAPVPVAEPIGPVAVWPRDEVRLKAREDMWNVATSAAAKLKLDPKKSYRLTLEAPPPGKRKPPEIFFFGERAKGTKVEGSFGALPAKAAVTVTGLRALYGFVLDAAPKGSTWAPKIKVTELKTRRPQLLAIDATRSAIAPDARIPHFEGLDPKESYRVTLSGSAELGQGAGPIKSVFYLKANQGNEDAGLLDSDAPLTVKDATALWLLLPDDDPADNTGELSVRVALSPK